MYLRHKNIAVWLFVFIVLISYIFLPIKISEALTQNLITFFSITFGFYMTSLSVLYGSSLIQKLYDEIDPNIKTQTKLHTLKYYFVISSNWALLSIGLLILFSLLAYKDNEGFLFLALQELNIAKVNLNIDLLLKSFIVSISTLNFLFIFLLMKIFFNGLFEEAKNKK